MSLKFAWDFWAKHYDKLWVQKYSLKPTRNRVLSILDNIKKENSLKILDVGCGIGELLRDIKNKFVNFDLHLYGLDYSSKMIVRAKSLDSSINYKCMDVSDISKNYSNMDSIICTHSFPYYKDKRMVLEAFQKTLRPNGTLILAQASENSLYDKIALFFVKFTTGNAKYLSIEDVKKISNGLFKVEKVEIIKEKFFMPSIALFVLKRL